MIPRSKTYIPPKRPYSFLRMLDDILAFGADMLVDNGRLCMWMPVAGNFDSEEPAAISVEYGIPRHPALEVIGVCVQDFNKCEYFFTAQSVC